MIYHITPGAAWNAAQSVGEYQGDTLSSEGFIHCSGHDQVVRTANGLFRGVKGLVLLEINPEAVGPEIRYEALSGVEKFPHIYGPLNLNAVENVLPFEPGPEGSFQFPKSAV